MKKVIIAGMAIACLPMLVKPSTAGEQVLSDTALDSVTASGLLDVDRTDAFLALNGAPQGSLLANPAPPPPPPPPTPPAPTPGAPGGDLTSVLANAIAAAISGIGSGNLPSVASITAVTDVEGDATGLNSIVAVAGPSSGS